MKGLPLLVVLVALSLFVGGCNGGDPEPVVGDNPSAANGRKAEEVATPEQKARRAASKPQGNPW